MEDVKFDKITARIKKLCWGLDPKFVDPVRLGSPLTLYVRFFARRRSESCGKK